MPTIYFSAWQDRMVDDPAPAALAKELDRHKASRAYILMPAQLHANESFLSGLTATIGDRIAGIYSTLPQHSPLPDVFGAAREASEAGADLLISIGGGSNIDAAKLVQYCLAIDSFDMPAVLAARDRRAPGTPQDGRKPVRHVCVPTTLSGAEFTYFAGGRNPETGLKEPFSVPDLLPGTVVFDQALATLTPQTLWLSSGIRALDHAIEGLLSDRNHPFGETLALQGIAQLREGLTITHADPADLNARRTSQYGGWFASIPLMTGVPMGLSHAIGHVIGSLFDVPHGLTSCVGLPAVMQFNHDAVPERFEPIARALGGTAGHEAPDLLRKFIASLGLPTTLAEVGLGRDALSALASGVMHEGWAKTNPRRFAGEEDVVRLLETML